MSESRNRVLITGASGFIGQHCIPLLNQRDWEVHAASREQSKQVVCGVEWHQVDLLDSGQLRTLIASIRPSHLLHLAWFSEHSRLYTASENYSWVRASLELLELFVQQGGKRVVMTGTCAEYDQVEDDCSEKTTALAPNTGYGICKRSLGDLLQSYVKAEAPAISGAWARLFFLYGPGEHPERLVASVVRAILSGEPALCTHGKQIRDYLYVEDAAEALVSLLSSELIGAINVCSGQPIALRELILVAARQLGGEQLVKFDALSSRDGEIARIVGDPQRLRDELGWSPSFDLQRGLERTVGWWRERLGQSKARPEAGAA